jgi:hypothetical protein
MDHIFFFYFAAVIAATSLLVVALRNPVYSALSLLIMFFHVAGLYVTLHAEFLAAVQIVVYAGAILVLYLFVVMLLSIKSEERYHNQLPVAGIARGGAVHRSDPAVHQVADQRDGSGSCSRSRRRTRQYGNDRGSLVLDLFVPVRGRVVDPAGGHDRGHHPGEERHQ